LVLNDEVDYADGLPVFGNEVLDYGLPASWLSAEHVQVSGSAFDVLASLRYFVLKFRTQELRKAGPITRVGEMPVRFDCLTCNIAHLELAFENGFCMTPNV
jgi:hypothetical protein